METAVINIKGEEVGKCEMPETVFGLTPDKHFLHEAVTAYLANQRAGTACAKTRAECRGGGKKPWKQKGTGRARHGSIRSPIWTGGGVVFGPRPHSFRKELPRKKRKLALAQALSAKFADGSIKVVDSFELAEAKTKLLVGVLSTLSAGRKPLLVTTGSDSKVLLAGRNISDFHHARPENLHTYQVLNCTSLFITKEAVTALTAKWLGEVN